MCVDFIKGKCARDTCKYFHPPEHLVAQLKKQKIANNAAVAAVLNAANNLNIYQQQQPPPNLQFNPFLGLTTTSSPPIHLQTMPMTSTPHFAHLHAQIRHQAPMHLLGSSQTHLRSNLNFHGTTNNSSRLDGQNAAFLNSFTSSHLNNMSNLNNGAYFMNSLQQQQQQQHLTDLQMVNLLNRNNFNNNSIKTTLNNNNNYNTSSLTKTSNVSPNSSAISNTTNNIGNNNNNSNTQQAPSNFNAQLSAPAITAASATANAAATAVGTNNSLVGRRSKQNIIYNFDEKPRDLNKKSSF